MSANDKKIVIVEDDADLRTLLTDRCKAYGYQVFAAEEGQKGLTIIVENKPHLVLSDLLLPKMDGFTILEKVRHDTDPEIAKTKFIVLSNLWSNKDILRVRALHVEDFFVKANTNLEDVFDKVKEVLKENGGN